jgi:hypothetical protein
MFCEYMFRYYLFSFILLFSTSSMFELLVVVAAVVMLNILELIMEIVPNYPTVFGLILRIMTQWRHLSRGKWTEK